MRKAAPTADRHQEAPKQVANAWYLSHFERAILLSDDERRTSPPLLNFFAPGLKESPAREKLFLNKSTGTSPHS
jgi:hypothetical protein